VCPHKNVTVRASIAFRKLAMRMIITNRQRLSCCSTVGICKEDHVRVMGWRARWPANPASSVLLLLHTVGISAGEGTDGR
jgi:hypothetical protein